MDTIKTLKVYEGWVRADTARHFMEWAFSPFGTNDHLTGKLSIDLCCE